MTPAEDPRLRRLSLICLSLPEATKSRSGTHATFRVRTKPFAYFLADHHGDDIVSVCIKAPRGENADWVAHDPRRYYLPAYIGPRGWLGLRLDQPGLDWSEVKDFVKDSYRLTAPKRLTAGA